MHRSATFAIWLALGAALLWGIWWLPIRALQDAGLGGVWAGVAMMIGAVPVLLVSLAFGRLSAPIAPKSAFGAAFAGMAMMLYSGAITDTTVVRAVLLFYLAPAWSIGIECLFFGRKFRWINALAFVLALIGVVFIFRGQLTFAGWRIGDTMALFSGFAWAIGAALIFGGPPGSVRGLALIACVSGTCAGVIMALALGIPAPGIGSVKQAGMTALGAGVFYLAPSILATIWSARRLAPAMLSFLLTAEIISGVGTAAIFLSEPFGWPELTGAAFIAAAAVIEVMLPRLKPPSG